MNYCFECAQPITEKHFETAGVYLHWSCVRSIVNSYVISELEHDTDSTKRMEAEALADKLGYKYEI